MNIFTTNDYMNLTVEGRVIVDDWLREKDMMELGVSFIQTNPNGEGLLLCGPGKDDGTLQSQYEVVPLGTLEADDFPWEVIPDSLEKNIR